MNTYLLLSESAKVREKYSAQFQYVLVDEYQDTNKIQASIIKLFSSHHHNLLVVGDDAQSIYSWRGANLANIISFQDRYKNSSLIRLETNYRSVPEILNLANVSIAQNETAIPKTLRAIRASGVKPALISLEDGNQQAQFVVQRSLELMEEEGIEPHEIAVLYRAHFHSMELQMELTRRNIPFQITSGLRFFEQAHIKDVAAYLRFFINPDDEISFKRIAHSLPSIGIKTASKMWQQFHANKNWSDVKVPDKARDSWNQWKETHLQLNDVADSPSRLIHTVVEAIYRDYLKVTYTNYFNRLEDLNQLQNFAANFNKTDEFLAQLALLTNVEAEDNNINRTVDGIRLSSIHQAKGLEFKVVFVIMLCDGLFPSFRSLENKEGEEEERRLFYVSVTRAKDELYLTYPKIRYIANQGEAYQTPSRFLEEFPRNLCNSWNIRGQNPYSTRPR